MTVAAPEQTDDRLAEQTESAVLDEATELLGRMDEEQLAKALLSLTAIVNTQPVDEKALALAASRDEYVRLLPHTD